MPVGRFLFTPSRAHLGHAPDEPYVARARLPELPGGAERGRDTFSASENLIHLVHGERADWFPRARTLRQLLPAWVAHDLGHVAQRTRVIAKQYREAEGPWREYLPVLDC